jgi:HAD superfamily hydrolase (TIGR01484 family)
VGKWHRLNGRINEILKILFISRESDALLERIELEMSERLTGKAAVQRSIPHVIEVTNLIATKDRGLQFLSDTLHIPATEMIAVGDGENDLRMLKYVGCGVAVANALPSLKDQADLIIGSNDENGLARAIFSWLGEEIS